MRHPGEGDPTSDFQLLTPFEVEVSLHASLLRGYVLLEFIRGTWDPNARERIAELTGIKPRLDERSVRPLLVSCERTETARAYLEAHSNPLTVLIDRTRSVSKTWGVYQRFSFGALHVARTASFLVDRCGFVRFAHVGRSPVDVASVDTLITTLERIDRESSPSATQRDSS